MPLECRITDLEPQPHLLDFFSSVLDEAARKVGADPTVVGRVVVASEDQFGDAVRSVRAGASHTNTSVALAVGKTLPRFDGDDVISDIVLNSSVFEMIGAGFNDPANYRTMGDQGFYVVCHELAHARDYATRRDAASLPDPRSDTFSVAGAARYYGSIVLTEFAACRLAATGMTDAYFRHELGEVGGRLQHCVRETNEFLDEPGKLTRGALAHNVCQSTWVVIVELAKLFGHATGRPDREQEACEIADAFGDSTALRTTLAYYGETYPKWTTELQVDELTNHWSRYAGIFGVRFVTRSDGSDDIEYPL